MRKTRRKLSHKLVIGFILLGSLICAASVAISYINYKKEVEKQYNDTAYRIAASAMAYIDGDAIARYLKTGQTDQAYEVMGQHISQIRANMEANYIYVAGVEGLELTYVYDADNPVDGYQPFKLGDKGTINPKFKEETAEILSKGIRSSNYFYSHSQFGYNTSAIVPIYSSEGEIVAILGVEVAMEALQNMLLHFILLTLVASAALTALFITAYLIYLRRKVVKPILTMTEEAESFIQKETQISERLQAIKTGDEIEQLAQAIHQLEVDINVYIDDLTQVTAERERISAELDVATQIQTGMLPCIFPAFPDYSEFDIHATMLPAREVGGDFYDFFILDDRKLVFLIADVSGKGIPAALFMVITKTLLANQAREGNQAADIFTAVNAQLCENNDAHMFVTAWMGIYDLDSGILSYVNAGHNPPLIRRGEGQYEYLACRPGFVLGGMEGIIWQSEELYLGQGADLLLYTDGITEAINGDMALYGEDRLLEVLNHKAGRKPADTVEAVIQDVKSYVGEAPQFDDITMLALQVLPFVTDSLTVGARLEELDRVLAFVDDCLEKDGCPKKAQQQVRIALDELLSNIVRHSGSDRIQISCRADQAGIFIQLRDQGVPHDPLAAAEPDVSLSLEDRQSGGLGIFLVKKLMDRVTYAFEGGDNVLTIYKAYQGDED